MSWESSAQYYRLANELVRERLGGVHSARIVLASVDFADVEALQVAGRWDDAAAIRPATSMVEVSKLIDPTLLVEIEADAVIP